MIRPSSLDFAAGHRSTIVVMTGIAGLTAIVCLARAVAWYVPAIALVLCKACYSAKGRVATWQAWRGAWHAMGEPEPLPSFGREAFRGHGPPPPGIASPYRAAPPQPPQEPQPLPWPGRKVRNWLALGWAGLLLYLFTHTDQGATPFYGGAFIVWIGLQGALLIEGVLRLVRWGLTRVAAHRQGAASLQARALTRTTREAPALSPVPDATQREVQPMRAGPDRPPRVPRALLWGAWLAMLAWLFANSRDPDKLTYGKVGSLFLLLSVWGIAAKVRSFVRASRSLATTDVPEALPMAADEAPTPDGSFIVGQCLPVPTASVRAGSVSAVLPAYARDLLRHSATPEASGSDDGTEP